MYRGSTRKSAVSPRLLLVGGGLVVAAVLAMLPGGAARALRSPAELAFAPGRRGAAVLTEGGRFAAGWLAAQSTTTAERANQRRRLERLERENRRLRIDLEAARRQVALLAAAAAPESPLLDAEAIDARILGPQARAYLAETLLVDAGRRDGARAGAPVVEQAALTIDQGRTTGVEKGQAVLAGCRVWGKVLSVGQHTSFVCRMTDRGFRDLVCLGAAADDGRPVRLGAKGILEGTGQSLARLRMVPTTEPVAEDDLVYSLAGEGFVATPLLCGRVVRVERPQGSAHWEIWVEPAAEAVPESLAILRPALNADRVAAEPHGPFRRK